MLALKSCLHMILVSLLLPGGPSARAQDAFPSRYIELIVPYGTGGGADQMARKLGPLLEPVLGVPVSVRNVPGGSGNVGLTRLLTRPADGHTAATLGSSTIAGWAAGMGYVRPHELQVVSIVQESPSMLFVTADSAFRTFGDLLAFAKVNPGRIQVATSGQGSNGDVILQYLSKRGYAMGSLPYANPEQRYSAPLNRSAQALYEEPGDVAHLLAKRQVRPLVLFDAKRHPAFPVVPTAKELGFDTPDLPNLRMLVVPAAVPRHRVARLARGIEQVLDEPEWQGFCARTFSCASRYTPHEAAQHIQQSFNMLQSHLRQSRTRALEAR
jgi:tripartite-type tricarboxylate transporter receptor subunit TctC